MKKEDLRRLGKALIKAAEANANVILYIKTDASDSGSIRLDLRRTNDRRRVWLNIVDENMLIPPKVVLPLIQKDKLR